MAAVSSGGIKGSLRWMAHELLEFSSDSRHTKQTDVWAFGMTVYEILARGLPYAHLRSDALVVRAITEHILPSCPPGYDDWHPFLQHAWTICAKCWISPPERRITMEGVTNDLRSIKHTNVINNATTGDLSQTQSNQQGSEPAYAGMQITFVDSDSSSSASDDDPFDQHEGTIELGNGEAEARHEEYDFDDNAYGYLANEEFGYEEEEEAELDYDEAYFNDNSSD
ncbi:uncharacterized protein FOMMEDRAFT_160759 [Fomitiporia mediterranea MF3/22]|uniref:uncharacterized protein n=1 Tax=Fomitiporia mediterranea (strain MF3/22) TaxID=694068 RepID=UPI0004408192|nr:uncharacterized protein FOMMEDRAFT_160759 [Fomitiporia mediterranea MF3/22]EJC99187.1 hypothetical protein FOMMEDRAFT_160759 [Fomitiporia mediterranea MF3/22]